MSKNLALTLARAKNNGIREGIDAVNYGTAKERRAKKIRGVPHTKEHKEKISQGLKAYYSEHEAWNKGRPNCGSKMDGGNDND